MVYFVESFYVNVGAGDCAIHLLVDVPEARAQQFHDNDSKKDTLRPAGSEIVNAILLDGGHNELGVISNIRETIKQIETMYGIDCLKFDTIALSHWDGDHFRGAMMYLSEELHAEYNYKEIHKDVTKQRITNGSITNFRRFKYDATGMKTTFYSPRLQYAAEDSKTELHYITDHSEQDPTTLQQTNYLRMVIMSEDEHGDEVGVHTGGIAKICMGESAIGYDLFSGIGLVNGRTWRDLTNLQQLIAMSQAAVLRPTHPYFFCVGIEDKLAGQDAAEGASDVSSNASSMMCLLVWPRAGTELPKITLYTGGDAEMAQENRLVTWLRGTDDNMDYSVECIKLGHHGAATATSERIFKLNPDKFIISAGKEYGHPTFTTMCYLFSYCSKQGFDRTDPAILATRSPTWLDPRFLYRSDKDPDDPSVPNLKRIQEILRTTKGGLKRNVTFNLKKIYEDNRKTYRQFKRTLKAINPDAQFLSQFDRASKWTTVSQGFIAKVTDEYAFENKKFQDPFEYLTPGKHHTKEEEVFVKHASQAWYLAHVMAIRILRQLWNSHGIPRQPSPKQPIKEIRDAAKQVTYILVRAARSTAFDMGLNSFIISLGSVDLGATKWRRPEGEKTLAAFEPDEEELLQEDSDESEDSRTKKRKATMRKKLKGEIKTNNHQSRKAEKKITMDKMVDRSISIEKDKMDGGSNKGKGDKGDNKRKKKGPGGARGLAGADQMFFAKEVSEASSLEETIPNSNPAVAYDDLNPVRVFVRDIKMLQLPTQALNSFDLNHETSITLTWFRDFISAKQILVSGSVRDQSVTVDRIELKCQITDSAGSPYALEFSTAQEARETQFGTENGDKVDKIGYNQDDASLIFALTRCEKFSLGALMDIIELPSPKWVRALFGLVLLKPSSLSAPRSGIWYQPVWGQETTLRLEMEVDLDDGAAKPVVDFLKTHLGKIEIKNITAVGKKFSETALNASPETVDIQTSSTAYLHTTLSWPLDPNNKPLDIHSTICVHPEGVDLIIQFPSGPDIFKLLFTWLNDRLKQSGTSEMIAPELQENLSQALTRLGSISFILKYVSLSFTSADGHPRLASFSAKFEVPLGFGAPQGKRCVALAGISWTPGSFQVSGEIWTSFAAINFIPFSLNPTRELWLEMLKPNTENAITYLSLPNLIPGHTLTDYPHGIPDEITKGRIMVRFDADKNVILHISGTLQCGSQSSESPVPPIWLDKLHLSATYNFKTQAFAFLFKGVVDVRLDSEDNDDTPQDDMELKASVAHDSVTKSWRVTATALNLRFANIYSFFNKGSERGAVMSILSGISIPLLYVSYDYTKSQPSSFHLTGVINLGPLELDLLYDHKGTSWDLEAELKKRPNVGSNELTIEQILKGITDEIETLPDFLRNLALPLDKISLKLTCSRGQTHTDHIVFALELSIEPGFHLTFVQMQQYDPHKGSGTQPTPTPAPSPSPSPVFPTKRLIRLALTKLPPVKDIPLVEKLEQPFDQMGFLWLNEDLSRAEVAVMNTEVFKKPGEDLLFKDKVKSTSPTDCVLKAGSHFQIALKIDGRHEVVLDHVFDATDHKDKAPAPGPVSPSPGQPPHGDPHPSPSPDKPPPGPRQPAIDSKNSKSSSHAPVKKKMANISIQNMGLKLEKSTLNIILDASVTLGPISVSLLQFSLDIDLSKIKKLEDFLDIPVSFSIAGLALQYSKPPTTIAGAIKRLKGGNGDGYAGGLAITLSQWAFMAAGLYETINSKHDGKTYRTIFAFAKLEGPLVELEFVEIHGITGGFGYNSKIRFPTISEVTKFPFVTISTGSQPESNDPKSQLLALTDTGGTQGGWFTPQNDSFWLAAGLGIRAFQVLDVQAVISVDLSSDFRLGIFGEGLAVEPVGVSPDSQFLVVDLGFSAVVDPSKGIFCVSGELTPRSFILSRSCHLTGGFALAYFFEGSGHDGDWVFTVGGFHPAYNVPSHYPVPPRVGISWSYDDSFSITGAAYFAITPDCCMGGGRLDAIYASGRVRASFSAYADFLINFRPFQFKADVGVGVDVYATIGWGFLSHKVHLEVDALVELHGPPLAGTAHLHMWFISISIRFGPDKTIQDKLSLKNFLIMVKQAENEQKANAIPDFILQARKGVQDDSPSMVVKQDQEWLVRGSVLEFEIQSRVPIRGVACNDKRVDKLNEQRPVYSKPMRLNKSLTSEMVIDIVSQNNQRPVFQQAPTLKNVPTAIWGQYDEHADPEKGGLSILKADRSKAMISHVMGVVISSPEPLESKDNIPPFDPHKLNSLDVIEPPVIPNGEPPSPGSVPTKAPGANSEEQVKEVVSRWKKADFNMRTSILDQFVQFVDPLKDKGKVSKLYKGLHAAGRTPEKYLEQAREHLREAPMVC